MSPANSGSTSCYIANAINHLGGDGAGMWDEEDGFFYDVLHLPDGSHTPLKVRSMVGLIPLFAVETLEPRLLEQLPGFKRRMRMVHREPPGSDARMSPPWWCRGKGERRLLSIVRPATTRAHSEAHAGRERIPFALRHPQPSRAHHEDHPYVLATDGHEHRVGYEPGESHTGLFGGNSNWRGPVWFPLNYLLIESLQKFHHYLGDEFQGGVPHRFRPVMTLWDVAAEISRRLSRLS